MLNRCKTVSAAAILSMMATPVFAQAAVQEPGLAAFNHPNADILHAGQLPPRESAGAIPFANRDAYASAGGGASASSCARRYRSYDPASGTFLGYDGRRHFRASDARRAEVKSAGRPLRHPLVCRDRRISRLTRTQ